MAHLTDDEFAGIWTKFSGNATLIAKALNIDVRNVHKRRKNVEARRGIVLPSNPKATNPTRPVEYVEKIGHRASLNIQNGIVVIFSDAHWWPGDNSIANQALLRFLKANQPRAIICNGDAFDGAAISRHPPTSWAKMPDVADELQYCQQKMAEIEELAPKGCKLVWTAGNHDSRFSMRLATLAPQYAKVHGVDLPDHFPSWVFAWSCFINDNVVVKHRLSGGEHAAHNNTKKAGRTIVTGHLHRLAVSPITDYNGRRYGVDCGTLSDFGPDASKFTYAEDAPLNWASGFCVLTFERGELLPPELAVVQGKRCIFRGKPI